MSFLERIARTVRMDDEFFRTDWLAEPQLDCEQQKMAGWSWALYSLLFLFWTIFLVDKFTNIITNPSYDNSSCSLVYWKFGKNYSLINFGKKLLHIVNADHNPQKRMKYLRGRVPYYSNASASFNIKLLRAGDIEPNPGDVRNPCSVYIIQLRGLTERFAAPRAIFTLISSDVTPVVYCEIKGMSNYHWVCRFCIIRSAMPLSDVEDVNFLLLFQDGEKSTVNNQRPTLTNAHLIFYSSLK